MSTPLVPSAARQLWAALRMLLVMTVARRARLPAGVTGLAQVVFPAAPTAPSSSRTAQVVGSDADRPVLRRRSRSTSRAVRPRPATATTRSPSSASNLGPENPDLRRGGRGAACGGRRARRHRPRPMSRPTPCWPAAPASTRTSAPSTPRSRSPASPASAACRGRRARARRRVHRRAHAGLPRRAARQRAAAQPGPRRRQRAGRLGTWAPAGRLRVYLGAAPGRGQDLRHARRGPPARRARHRRGRRVRRDPRPARTPPRWSRASRWCRAARSPTAGATFDGDGRRRRARPAPDGRAGRRARPHQRARVAQRQALAGHRGAAGRRHRRHHHGQHPAPRVGQRRRREDHRRAAARDRARRRGPRGRPDRARAT